MIRVAVTKAALRIPPTYFAVQHSQRLLEGCPGRFAVVTFTMALDLNDPSLHHSGLEIAEAAAFPKLSFRQREVTMPLSFALFERAIVDFEPDVIHQHFATWAVPALRASRRTGAPFLVTLHGADVFAALRPMRNVSAMARPMLAWHKKSVARSFEHAHRVLPVSRFLADCAIEAGARATSLEVHYQGVDTDYFTPGDARAGEGAEVVFVGGFSRAKGVVDLIEASVASLSQHPHRLVLIGAGPLDATVRAAAAEYAHIDVVGSVGREEVRQRLRRASLLVLPTQEHNGWREAAGLVLLEAQACGTPVVTYDSGGAPEMLEADRTGLIVPERDIPALSDAIGQILALNESEKVRLATDAREWVLENRSLAVSAQQLGELYGQGAR